MKYPATLLFLFTLSSCSLFGGGDNHPDIPGKIVFAAKDTAGTSQIYTMEANRTDVKQLTHFGPDGGAADPAWSPDGQRIVFANYTGATTLGPYLYVMDADGDNMRPLKRRPNSSLEALVGSAPDWSPDGTKIAYQVCTNCERGGEDYEIVIVDAAGQTYDPAQVHAVTDHPASDTNPTWSPDGQQRIAFVSDRDYVGADSMRWRKDLYVINPNGTGLNRLTESGNATRPDWNPGGSKIAYEWNIRGNEVFVYNLTDQQIYKVETGLKFAGNPLWNNQGTKLMIFGRETEDSQSEMRLVDIMNNAADILQKMVLDEKAVGRDYDWFDDNQN